MTAEERMRIMMEQKMCDLPPVAIEYARFLGKKIGICCEVFCTAYAHYAQAVEGLVSTDSLYTIDPIGIQWFSDNSHIAEKEGSCEV